MTFIERYEQESTWQGRVMVMEIYHLAMTSQTKWNITKTAEYFGVSIGLVSENLRLATAMHADDTFNKIPLRKEAIRRLNTYGGNLATPIKRSSAELD